MNGKGTDTFKTAIQNYLEYRAMDKTALRKILFGRIDKIVEINK